MLVLKFSDKASFEMVNNVRDIELLNFLLGGIESGIACKLDCVSDKVFDEYQFERFLNAEFGKILTIK